MSLSYARPRASLPPFLIAAAAWALPGLGYWLIRQRTRGTTIGITVVFLFIAGLLIGGVRALEAPLDASGKTPSFNPSRWRTEIAEKPWYAAQILVGPIGIGTTYVSTWAGQPDPNTGSTPGVLSHARANEIGVLYMAVAGMLNLLAIIDSAYRAGQLLETA
jgi:hypothetical protein